MIKINSVNAQEKLLSLLGEAQGIVKGIGVQKSDANDKNQNASSDAHVASSRANNKEGHLAAAQAHLKAAAENRSAGNEDTAYMHRQMADYHQNRAARCSS